MQVCGLILSTENFNFFALRCSLCNSTFGQWTTFLKHISKKHNQGNIESEEWNLEQAESFDQDYLSNDELVTGETEEPKNVNLEECMTIESEANEEIPTTTVLLEEETANTSPEHQRPDNEFRFDLNDLSLKNISQHFLKWLKLNPCFWDSKHADYNKSYMKTKAIIQLKFYLKSKGYVSHDKALRQKVEDIIDRFDRASKQLEANVPLDESTENFYKQCIFLKDPVENNNIYSSLEANSDSWQDQGTKDSDNDGSDEIDESDNNLPDNAYRNMIQMTYRKYQEPFKRILFTVPENKILDDFINLMEANPSLYDNSKSGFLERKRIMTEWIDHFKNNFNIEFTYWDMSLNFRGLRQHYYDLLKKKNLDSNAKKFVERCSFLPPGPTLTRIACDYCDNFFRSEVNYKAHLKSAHNIGENPLHCSECNKDFETYSKWNHHVINVHKSYEHPCPDCGRMFKYLRELIHHSSVHTGEKRFICAQCGRAFRQNWSLKNHETRIHLRERNFPCEMCPKSFYTKGLLKDHINMHLNLRPFKCPTCGKGFHSAHSLMRHKQIHSDIKRYACKICDAKFNQFVGLNSHMKKRHNVIPSKNVSDSNGMADNECANDSAQASYEDLNSIEIVEEFQIC